jgi:uncharacterized protein (TIGR04255 family)
MAYAIHQREIPKRLGREPLIEVIWQAVFEEPSAPYFGELVSGIVYAQLHKDDASWQFQRLPAAEIPLSIAQQDPNLRFVAKYRIESLTEPILYQVGDRILSVNCRRPYVGWTAFKEKVLGMYKLLQATGIIPGPTIHALRYLDLIQSEDMADIKGLRLNVQVGDQEICAQPLQVRIELSHLGQTHILQIATPAQVHLREGMLEGTLIDLETRAFSRGEWSKIPEQLDDLHTASKAMFFQQLLRPETIALFEPEY